MAFLFQPTENRHLNDPNVFEGDMLLTPEQVKAAMKGNDLEGPGERAAIINQQWPGGVMVYEISPELGIYLVACLFGPSQ